MVRFLGFMFMVGLLLAVTTACGNEFHEAQGSEVDSAEDSSSGGNKTRKQCASRYSDGRCREYVAGDAVEAEEPQAAETSEGAEGPSLPAERARAVTLKGYVVSAWDVEVDGQSYQTSEDYYTSQLDKLTAEVSTSGYYGWTMKFDAEIGLSDLKNGMRVYIVGGERRGYAGETKVHSDGSFQFQFPTNEDARYKIRAAKRVSLTLVSPEKETLKWCFVFNAVEQDIDLTDPRPVLLSRFETMLTKYQCSASSLGGISIPER